MGDLVDLGKEREKRQAHKDRPLSKAYVPQETPTVDQDWDNEIGRYVETVHIPAAHHGDRDFGDEG